MAQYTSDFLVQNFGEIMYDDIRKQEEYFLDEPLP